MTEASMTPEEIKELIWSRCHWDGDCLVWDGACHACGGPVMRMPGSRKTDSARRVLLQAMGKPTDGYIATTTCDNPRCLAEDHCVLWTRKQLQKRSTKKMIGNAVRASKLAAWRRKTATLTMEQVREMRASDLTSREAAAKYGVTQSTAHKALCGDTWKEYGKSPFYGLGARA